MGSITHAKLSHAPSDPSALIDGPAWDAAHTFSLSASDISGLAPSATTDTTNASNITTGTLNAAQMPALAGTNNPVMDGTASPGSSALFSRQDHVHPSDTTRAPVASPVFTGTPTAPTAANGTNNGQVATTAFVLANASGVVRSYIGGLVLLTPGSSNSFTVAAGVAADSGNAAMIALASPLSKTTGGWAAGSGHGSLDVGTTSAANTWYHVHLIYSPTGPSVDLLTSLSATAPTLPSGYTLFRRIGAMKTNASTQWTTFTQIGDEFMWVNEVNDVNAASTNTTPTNYVLSVPPGVNVTARFQSSLVAASTTHYVAIYSPYISNPTGVNAGVSLYTDVAGLAQLGTFNIMTNTSAQVTAVGSNSGDALFMTTYGWNDHRGKDS